MQNPTEDVFYFYNVIKFNQYKVSDFEALQIAVEMHKNKVLDERLSKNSFPDAILLLAATVKPIAAFLENKLDKEPSKKSDKVYRKINELEMSVRLHNCLTYGLNLSGEAPIWKLETFTKKQFLRIRNFGNVLLKELEQLAEKEGLELYLGF